MPKAKLKDITLYYEVRGKGFPLLLIAGLGSDNSSWLGIDDKLAKNYQVIGFDNRGSGRSDIPSKKYSICQMTDDAIGLLDHLGIDKCHVIGHSMSGYIAQELAIRHPERIAKLILEGTAPVSSRRNGFLLNDLSTRLQSNKDIRAWFREWAYWLFSPNTFRRGTFIDTFINNASKHPYLQPAIGFKRQVEAIAEFDACGKIKSIKSKTLIIMGKDDILIYPQESMALAKSIRNSSVAVMENTAHCIHIENPGEFIKIVTDFLSG